MHQASRRRSARGEHGAVVVEFALIMPILLLLVFGAIQYGLYFFAYQGGADAARSAARLSAVGNPAACAGDPAAFVPTITGQVDDLGDNIVVRRTYNDEDLSGDVSVSDTVDVYVQFDSTDLRLPLLPFVNDGRVIAEARSRVEYVNDGQPEDCP